MPFIHLWKSGQNSGMRLASPASAMLVPQFVTDARAVLLAAGQYAFASAALIPVPRTFAQLNSVSPESVRVTIARVIAYPMRGQSR